MSHTSALDTLAQKYIPYVKMLAEIGNSAVFIVDKDKHYYFISNKFSLFGYDDIPKLDSVRMKNYPLTHRIHPDDLAVKTLIDTEIFDFFASLPPEERTLYKYIYEYRGMASDGSYGRVTHEMQLLEVTKDNYLALGIIEISPDQSENLPVRIQMKHCLTGEIIPIHLSEEAHPLLPPREKEILTLSSEGLSSKEISKKLFISIHTANRHRQNIREKLSAENMIEAVNIARRKGIL